MSGPQLAGQVSATASGPLTFTLRDLLPDPADEHRGKLVRVIRQPAHQQRDLITDPGLELPHYPVGIGERAALRVLPDDQRAVSGQEQHRWYGGRVAAQRNELEFQLVLAGRQMAAAVNVAPKSIPSQYVIVITLPPRAFPGIHGRIQETFRKRPEKKTPIRALALAQATPLPD